METINLYNAARETALNVFDYFEREEITCLPVGERRNLFAKIHGMELFTAFFKAIPEWERSGFTEQAIIDRETVEDEEF